MNTMKKNKIKHNFRVNKERHTNIYFIRLSCFILMLSILLISACGLNSPDPTRIPSAIPTAAPSELSAAVTEQPVTQQPVTEQPVTPTNTAEKPEIKEVEIPANLKLQNPDFVYNVPSSQKTQWMKYLTLFPDSAECKMLLYADPQIVQIDETVDRMSVEPVDSENHEIIENIGLLIAMNSENTDYKVEMLKVNLEFTGNEWVMLPVKNITKAKITLTQQLRIVSPRLPLTKDQVNETSKLKTFDPTPFTSPGKTPYRMRSVCIEPFMAMLNQSRSDGITSTTVRDIYRSYDVQELFFQSKIKAYQNSGLSFSAAKKKAESEVAAPGTSEHHDGFTADITTYNVEMIQGNGLSPLGNWLKDNCWDYGFIVRYLKGKEEQTTKVYEPWHVRFLGLPTSLFFKRYGIVLEEFHSYLIKNQYIITSFPDDTNDSKVSDPIYIYLRCKSADDILIPQEITNSAAGSTLLSETGDGSVVLMQRVNP